MRQLAVEIVADGEGSRRIGRVVVRGGDRGRSSRVARAVANSPLVKTALHGGDPNFGRILQAAGMALRGVSDARRSTSTSTIEGRIVVSGGTAALDFGEPSGTRSRRRWRATRSSTCSRCPATAPRPRSSSRDLGHEYVRINAEYTT